MILFKKNKKLFSTTHDKGIIETKKGLYTKTYEIDNINYLLEDDEIKNMISNDYLGILYNIDPISSFEVSVKYTKESFQNKFIDKIHIYLTIAIDSSSLEESISLFNKIEIKLRTELKCINRTNGDIKILSVEERLSLIDSYCNFEEPEFQINKKFLKSKNCYYNTFLVEDISYIDDKYILKNIHEIDSNMMISMHFKPLPSSKQPICFNYNDKLYNVSTLITLEDNNLDELNRKVKTVKTYLKGYRCNPIIGKQKNGMISMLPLAINKLKTQVMSLADTKAFIPFTELDVLAPSGYFVGNNAITRNPIHLDKREKNNFNSLVIGALGSGKTHNIKEEIEHIIKNSEDEVIVFSGFSEELNVDSLGKITSLRDGKNQINPFKIKDFSSESIQSKSDFILIFVETLMSIKNPSYLISNEQKTIIVTSSQSLYLKKTSLNPTIDDFCNEINTVEEKKQMKEIVSELMEFKNIDQFIQNKTSLNDMGRFNIYDLHGINDEISTLYIIALINHIWERIESNEKKNIFTWIYFDACECLYFNDAAMKFISCLCRRDRMRRCGMCFVSAYIDEIIEKTYMRQIISNCATTVLFHQNQKVADNIKNLFSLTETQIDYIKQASVGNGLLISSNIVVPFAK